VVPVSHEVQVAHPVHRDGRHRLAAPRGCGDSFPTFAGTGRRRTEAAVEDVAEVDGAQAMLGPAPESFRHLVRDSQDAHPRQPTPGQAGIITAVLYDVLVALHVASAVVGFGAVALSGLYGAVARRADRPEAGEETARYFRSPGRAEWLVLAVPFLGAAALGARPEGADFGATWVVGGALIWLAAAGLLLGVIRPAERSIRAAAGQPERLQGAALAGRRLTWAAAGSDLLFAAALVLMVWQPA
jgi:hypothetical protein